MNLHRKPAQVFTLAEYLYDEFVERGWKTADAARLFDNGVIHARNLCALNSLMLGPATKAPDSVMVGLSNALCVSEQFLRSLEQCAQNYSDRVHGWLCPLDILSQEMQDYIA